jgi:PiT family inorganic phosphate transporter
VTTEALLVLVIALSLLFTFTNGFQDGSSVCASAIASRALSEMQAVCLVAGMEFCGALLGGSAVANTIRSVCSYPDTPSMLPILIDGLLAAITWNFVTKRIGLPSSSTHALVGGILGSVIAAGRGFQYVVWGHVNQTWNAFGVCKVVESLLISPLIGFVAGYLMLNLMILLLMRASSHVNRLLKQFQWFTVSLLAFAHGANDTQKAMGVILLALNASGLSHNHMIPLWVRVLSGAAMACGIISLAPSIVRKVGMGIYKLRPLHGFVTQLASASVVLTGSITGGPVSASQVISSSVMGIGTSERIKGVHWLVAKDMLLAWFLTIPCSGLLAAVMYITVFQWL